MYRGRDITDAVKFSKPARPMKKKEMKPHQPKPKVPPDTRRQDIHKL